jgi:hypothetical protein
MNLIENLFSQLKSHVKNKSLDNFEELKSTIDKIIKYKITKEHLKNYFNFLFTQANDYGGGESTCFKEIFFNR